MNTIDSGNSLANPSASQNTASPPAQTLGQQDFFTLMIAQMRNQDPTKPLDGQEYLAQLAQFSTLNSMQQMQQSFETLSQSLQSLQMFQSFNLVGRSVLVDGNQGYVAPEQPLEGSVTLPDNVDNLTVRIYNGNGQEVRSLDLGSRSPGQVNFSWDGLSNQGTAVAPGSYRVAVEGSINGQTQSLTPQIWGVVQSIAVGQGGKSVSLQLAGLGDYSISEIREIR